MRDKERLKGFFENHAERVRARWYDALVAEYPPETVRYLKSVGDHIANPLGHVIKGTVDAVVAGLSSGAPVADLSTAMHQLIRIKAVQHFTPSQSVSGVLSLKKIIKDGIGEVDAQGAGEAMALLDPLFDEMLCSCFDFYMECRAKLTEIKEDELKRNLYMLLRKSELIETPGQGEG